MLYTCAVQQLTLPTLPILSVVTDAGLEPGLSAPVWYDNTEPPHDPMELPHFQASILKV
jgi:hypothetical protein